MIHFSENNSSKSEKFSNSNNNNKWQEIHANIIKYNVWNLKTKIRTRT